MGKLKEYQSVIDYLNNVLSETVYREVSEEKLKYMSVDYEQVINKLREDNFISKDMLKDGLFLIKYPTLSHIKAENLFENKQNTQEKIMEQYVVLSNSNKACLFPSEAEAVEYAGYTCTVINPAFVAKIYKKVSVIVITEDL